MFRFDPALKVYLHRDPVDGRKAINGLSLRVEQARCRSHSREQGVSRAQEANAAIREIGEGSRSAVVVIEEITAATGLSAEAAKQLDQLAAATCSGSSVATSCRCTRAGKRTGATKNQSGGNSSPVLIDGAGLNFRQRRC